MDENDWNEIIDNAVETVLREAEEELGEEAEIDTITRWLQTQQMSVIDQQGHRAHLKESLLQFISADQANWL